MCEMRANADFMFGLVSLIDLHCARLVMFPNFEGF